jgi:outer membrane usher protein
VGARLAHACLILLALLGSFRAGADEPQEAYFDLYVNEQHLPSTLVVLRGEDVLVPPKVLLDAGFSHVPGDVELIDGKQFVSLKALAPGVGFTTDDSTLTLKVTANAALFEPTRLNLYSLARPKDFHIQSAPSAFANYSLELTNTGRPGVFTEVGGSVGTALFTTGWSKPPGKHAVRGLTTLTYDQPEVLRRWQLGEEIASTGVLGGSALLAGFGVQTDFALDPYQVHHPLPTLSGAATTPSRLDVYVNGRLVRQETIGPGAFSLENLPASAGAGSVQYVLQDAFGRTQTFSTRYYLASALLNAGEDDFAYQVGFPRLDLATESFSFSPHPAFMLRHRRGITDGFTFGGRFEGGWKVASGGPTLAYALPVGELQANAALSSGGYDFGAAGALSYSLLTKYVNVGTELLLQSDHYATVSLDSAADRPVISFDVFAGVPVPAARNLSIFATYRHEAWRDLGNRDSFEMRADYGLAQNLLLLVSARRSDDPQLGTGYGAMLSLLVTLDKDVLAQASASRASDQTQWDASLQKSVPPYTGYGYRLEASNAGVAADGVYSPAFGRYEANFQRLNAQNSGFVSASGGLVYMDHSLSATQPIQNGYALIELPGVEGVRGMLNNQTVGTTNDKGNLLVPNVSSYVANRVGIVSSDVPMTYDLPRSEHEIAIPFRAGTIVRFEAHRVVAISGTVAMISRAVEIPPTYGLIEVEVNGATVSSPLGKDGAFFLENIPPGQYVGHVRSDSGDCLVSIEVPSTGKDAMIDLGKLTCPKLSAPAPTQASGGTP